eukprot:scaffold2908_cov257-Pinguiococcus_pyrenoidosus.AAC.45
MTLSVARGPHGGDACASRVVTGDHQLFRCTPSTSICWERDARCKVRTLASASATDDEQDCSHLRSTRRARIESEQTDIGELKFWVSRTRGIQKQNKCQAIWGTPLQRQDQYVVFGDDSLVHFDHLGGSFKAIGSCPSFMAAMKAPYAAVGHPLGE